jgi:hypothetical protein
MMFALLAGASVFSVVIWRVRLEYTGKLHYRFLIWNLFLAWIPFVISYFTYTVTLKRKWIYAVIPVAAFFWLIFFPNAPYILTDFQHLASKWRDLPVWYDVMMLIWFAFTGLLLGMVSLFLMQEIIRREFGRWVGWAFAPGAAVCRHMGRSRWNLIFCAIRKARLIPSKAPNRRSFFLYITLYTFGHLLERPVNTSSQGRPF